MTKLIRGSDFKKALCAAAKVCQVGYVTKERIISRLLQEETRFGFTHKPFLEFLTARHITLMNPEERLTWLQGLHYAWLIGELNDVHPERGDVIVKRCPPHINIYSDCSASCRKGTWKLGNLQLQPPILLKFLNVYWENSTDEEYISFVKKSIKCKCIDCSWIWIEPCNGTRLRNIVSELRVGQADSFQQMHVTDASIAAEPTSAECENAAMGTTATHESSSHRSRSNRKLTKFGDYAMEFNRERDSNFLGNSKKKQINQIDNQDL
ncbi:hypothetical protein CAPTEDRAFT_216346 [Capitella teleta]|uniref:Uncharacterized protein n=1 Tax=Capitella teleta TaxID=283909 RepID=R7VGX9_CAPTE|nr:hypothetical protein CAPTEDRAFT_216346 [Capitella teleta]|eukprot:ELU17864.1 hypothetical protein CAPTEDRAFT_216346 [Capitella teleta]